MDAKQISLLAREDAVSNDSVSAKPKTFYGDEANNFYNITHYTDRIVERANGGIDTVFATTNYVLPQNVENLFFIDQEERNGWGNDASNNLAGNENRNRLFGESGDDFLYGNGGNDFLDGGSGKDTMVGGRGNDVFVVDDADDKVIEFNNQGLDTVLSSISYKLPQYVENLKLTGTEAINAEGNDNNNRITGNNSNNYILAGKGNDIVDGRGGDDTIYGGDGSDRLIGRSGNDTLIGGTDTHPLKNIYGETYWGDVNDGDDYLDGGTGDDTLIGGKGDDTYFFARGYGHDTIIDYRIPGIETLYDPQGNNTVRFGSGIRPEDLDISVDILPGGSIDNTWKVNIKGTDDILFIRNQNTGVDPAIMNFEFDSKTLTAFSLAETVGVRGNVKEITIDKDQAYRMNIDDFSIGSDNSVPEFIYNIENITGGRLAYMSVDGQVTEWVSADSNLFSYFDGGNFIFVPDSDATDAAIQFRFNSYSEDSNSHDAYHTIHFNLEDLPDNGGKILFGDEGNNTIVGTDSSDALYGLSGHDILDGKAGNDLLYGGEGDDTYLFGHGYGADTIIDMEGTNSVHFAEGISWTDLTLVDNYSGEIFVGDSAWKIGFKDTKDVLIIENQSNSEDASVTSFIFDNEVLTHNMLAERINNADYLGNDDLLKETVQPRLESYSYADNSSTMAMAQTDDHVAINLI